MASYVSAVLAKAFAPTARVMDGVALILGPVISALTEAKYLPEKFPGSAALVAAGISIIAFRLLLAPYLVWKDQEAEIEALTSKASVPEVEFRSKVASRDFESLQAARSTANAIFDLYNDGIFIKDLHYYTINMSNLFDQRRNFSKFPSIQKKFDNFVSLIRDRNNERAALVMKTPASAANNDLYLQFAMAERPLTSKSIIPSMEALFLEIDLCEKKYSS